MRILFVKLGAIGDIVHTLPSLALVSKSLPDAEIDWVVESRSAEILRGNPLIRNLIEVDTHSIRSSWSPDRILNEIRRQVSDLRSRSYDIAIDLQGLLKSSAIARLSGARRRVGFDTANLREGSARVLYTEGITVDTQSNVIDKNVGLVRNALNIEGAAIDHDFPIFTGPEHRLEADAIASRVAAPFALLNPGGGWATKLWRAADYGRLARRLRDDLGTEPIVVTGPGESHLATEARSFSGFDLIAAEPSLKGFFELARRASVYVGGDTGPTHIAVAAGAPVVGIFGPTQWWRNGSPHREDICVGRDDIPCRVDCHRRKCSEWICMDISVETVFAAVARRLELAAKAPTEAAV